MTNPANWNWNQIDAAGRHVLNTGCTVVATLAATHFITGLTPQSAADIATNVNQIWHGVVEVATGVVGLLTAAAPIYTALKSAASASPSSQIKSVAATLAEPKAVQDANAAVDPTSRTLLVNAVAQMPEVKAIVATPIIAQQTTSDKVVATLADVTAVVTNTKP
jgi:hypothetical protein